MFENGTRAREYDSPGMVYGFFAGTGMATVFLCLMLAALLTGCGKGGSGSVTLPPPPPPQDQYEPLPAIHQLRDSGEKPLKMWVTMLPGINPPRGSTVGDGAISAVPIEVKNKTKQKIGGSWFDFYWSRDDRVDSSDESAGHLGVGPNGSQQVVLSRWSGNFAPRYLLIGGRSDGETGMTSFLLDYR